MIKFIVYQNLITKTIISSNHKYNFIDELTNYCSKAITCVKYCDVSSENGPLNGKFQTQFINCEKAANYIISFGEKSQMPHFGFYLVKIIDGKTIGSLLIKFQSPKKWSIQSVFIQKQYRRQGHFTSLFNKAIQIAKQKGVESVCVYVQTENKNAKQTYYKLGMKTVQGKIYSYDFVYGGANLEEQDVQQYQFQSDYQQNAQIKNWVENKQNKLGKTVKPFQENKDLILIRKNQNLMGVVRYFEQFSDWRFGIMRYVRQIYLDQSCPLEDIIAELNSYLVNTSEIKVAAVRFFVSQEVAHQFKGGRLQNYEAMQLKLS